jgi:outer membrane receptor protein involved in Fe transport
MTLAQDSIVGIPPNSWRSSLGYELKKNIGRFQSPQLKIIMEYAAKQKRVPAYGNIPILLNGITTWQSDFMPPPQAYSLLHLECKLFYQATHRKWPIYISLNNLTNKKYRSYTDQFRYFADQRGINLSIKTNLEI